MLDLPAWRGLAFACDDMQQAQRASFPGMPIRVKNEPRDLVVARAFLVRALDAHGEAAVA
jgi:hypothetical protein